MAEDPWQGDAQFTVAVDGQQVGGTQTTTAVHWEGQAQTFKVLGNWAPGPHTVTVTYTNDAVVLNAQGQGIDAEDRNLYVMGMSDNGTPITSSPGTPWELASTGSQSWAFNVANSATTTIPASETTATINLSQEQIVATSGDHTLFVGGSYDTVQMSGGNEKVVAHQGHTSIATGGGNDTIAVAGTGNVVNTGGGENWIGDWGSNDTIALPGPGQGLDHLFGNLLAQGNTLDLTGALAHTAWDGSQATLGQFIQVASSGGNATIAMRATVGGAASVIATLNGVGAPTLQSVLAHATV